jgi:hypothetical protein
MFQEFSPYFGPDDLDAMSAAFDAVWVQLAVAGVVLAPAAKQKLARVILAAACTGERSKERLKSIASRAVLGSQVLDERA